jgi:nitroreductase
MPAPNQAVLDFLLSRRSHPARTLSAPAPDRAALLTLLTAAARVPDHGKLEPWRFVVLGRAALDRLAGLAAARGAALGLEEERIAKAVAQYRDSPLAVAVVQVPRPTDKVPAVEQTFSAGAVCLGLLNAALAAGWGACWLTGWPVYDRAFLAEGLGLSEGERIAGMIHIGTAGGVPPDRPRPDLARIVTWEGP